MEYGELRADCTRCAGLCCVGPPFAASADIAEDKPAGVPCRHLGGDFRCGIHDHLRSRGYELVRAPVERRAERRGADLIGRDLRGTDLRGANCAAPTCSAPTCAPPTCDSPT
jgi:hypothetical protein